MYLMYLYLEFSIGMSSIKNLIFISAAGPYSLVTMEQLFLKLNLYSVLLKELKI